MPSKLCLKSILEGTRPTLKTDIAFALNEPPRIVGPRQYRYHSPLISAEWCASTFRVPVSVSLTGWNPPAGCGRENNAQTHHSL